MSETPSFGYGRNWKIRFRSTSNWEWVNVFVCILFKIKIFSNSSWIRFNSHKTETPTVDSTCAKYTYMKRHNISDTIRSIKTADIVTLRCNTFALNQTAFTIQMPLLRTKSKQTLITHSLTWKMNGLELGKITNIQRYIAATLNR